MSWTLRLVRPNRYCLTLIPELKLRISRKNALRRSAQSTKKARQIREFEIHSSLVRGARKQGLWWQIAFIVTRPQILLELHENCQEQVPQRAGIKCQWGCECDRWKFFRTHENTVQSPLSAVTPSALTSPRKFRKAIKRLRSGKTPGFDGVPRICPVGRSFIWLMCSTLVLSYVIFLK
jgi:hypothetical protein